MFWDKIFIISLIVQTASLILIKYINAKLSQNEMNSRRDPNKAIDGNELTCSITQQYRSGKEPWWRVELIRPFNITNLTISYGVDSHYSELMNNWKIYISNTNQNFEEHLCIFSEDEVNILTGGSRIKIQINCLNAIFGKYVTIKRVAGNQRNTLALCEVSLEASWKLGNLALGRETMESGIIISGKPEFVVDGDIMTCAVLTSESHDYGWWRIILDDSYYVANITIYFVEYSAGKTPKMNITVFVSNDYHMFEANECGTATYSNDDKKRFVALTCKKPIFGHYVTIKKTEQKRTRLFIICEVEVFSKFSSEGVDSSVVQKECLDHEYKCQDGQCINKNWLCDGTQDCKSGDDEFPACTCSEGSFRCLRSSVCIENNKRCDYHTDCPDHSDEEKCLSVDLEDGFVKGIFQGKSGYYICSQNWTIMNSIFLCEDYQKGHEFTEFAKINANKHLRIRENVMLFASINSFANNLSCESNKFVKLQCGDSGRGICGSRGFPDNQFDPYVINGANAKEGAWPWMAQIYHQGFFKCGGSIIDKDWILTADHCLRNKKPSDVFIKVGTNQLFDYFAPKLYASYFVNHPDLGELTDVALIRLNSSIKYTKHVRPICLPHRVYNPARLMSFRHCVLSGFGYTSRRENKMPSRLQQGRMNILNSLDCLKYAEEQRGKTGLTIAENELCAGTLPLFHGINACEGDSGGPLVCKDEDDVWTQVGIMSYTVSMLSYRCVISIFARVDRHLQFIQDVMSKNRENMSTWRASKIIVITILVFDIMF